MRRGAGRKRPRATKASDAELDTLIEKATVDAYDEIEQMVGFHTMLDGHIEMPFKTEVLGVEVTVEKIDLADDNQIAVICTRGKSSQGSRSSTCRSETAPEGRGVDRRLSPMTMWGIVMVGEIDRDKLRAALRSLGNEYIFYMLYDAVELMPPATLETLVSPYLELQTLRPDDNPPESLLVRVTAFARASLAGDFYEEFRVDSTNDLTKSTGTIAWIAECNRLLDLCVADARSMDPSQSRQCFDTMFALLDEIDAGRDIIFFADEAGSWQVWVDWQKVLPPWFKVLSATSTPEEYASRVMHVVNHHCGYEGPVLLGVAREAATPAQKRALSTV